MPVIDSPYITQGNSKKFVFDLRDDDGNEFHDLRDVQVAEFVLKDLDGNEKLRLVAPYGVKLDTPRHSAAEISISAVDSGNLDPGSYRYALQLRWSDGRVHEFNFPNVFMVFAQLIS